MNKTEKNIEVKMNKGFKIGQDVYYAKYIGYRDFAPDISKVYKIVITQNPNNDIAFDLQYILEANKGEKIDADYVCKTEDECKRVCRILNRF